VLSYVTETLGKPGTNDRNMDPELFFSTRGINLVHDITAAAGTTATADADELTATEGAGTSEEEASPSRENAAEHTNEAEEVRASSNSQIVAHVDNQTSRGQLARWALLNDHWYQHNLEYLSGTITMRGAPEIRVGMRLDVVERNMSFYVEGVQHTWTYPNEMKTTLQVTRGQPNNPYPAYVIPPAGVVNSTSLRRKGSRLAVNFMIPDPVAVRRSLAYVDKEIYPSDGVDYSPFSPDNPDNWSADVYEFDETPILEMLPAESAQSSIGDSIEIPGAHEGLQEDQILSTIDDFIADFDV
jgi:hypothetical protein